MEGHKQAGRERVPSRDCLSHKRRAISIRIRTSRQQTRPSSHDTHTRGKGSDHEREYGWGLFFRHPTQRSSE